jgi:SAM-dependent methyltransferase
MKKRRPADINDIYSVRADTMDYFFPDREDEIDFWADLASEYGNDILHIMCSTGELTAKLAKRGFNLTGLDVTEAMVYEAEDKMNSEKIETGEIIQDDARYFNLGKRFDFAFIASSDFHHFTERKEIDNFLAKTYAHLRKGGGLALELLEIPDEDFHRGETKFEPERAPPENMTLWKRNKASYHSDSKTYEITEEIHVEVDDDVKNVEYEILFQLYTKDKIKEFLEDSGFENIRFLDGSNYSPYLKDVKTWVVVAERI